MKTTYKKKFDSLALSIPESFLPNIHHKKEFDDTRKSHTKAREYSSNHKSSLGWRPFTESFSQVIMKSEAYSGDSSRIKYTQKPFMAKKTNLTKQKIRMDGSWRIRLGVREGSPKKAAYTSSSFVIPNSNKIELPVEPVNTVRKLSKPSKNIFGKLKFQSKEGSIEDYEFGKLLGKGAYGEVYEATLRKSNLTIKGKKQKHNSYAIKVYDRYLMSQANKLKCIKNEIRIL